MVTELKANSTFCFQTVGSRLSSMRLIRMDLNRKLDMRAKRMPVEDMPPAVRMITTTVILLGDRVAKVVVSRITQDLMEAVVTVVIQVVASTRESSVDLIAEAVVAVISREDQVR